MIRFKQYIAEGSEVETFMWSGKPLYHGTSMGIARKILKSRSFDVKDGGYDEMGYGLYTHPSMNRTSPWTKGTTAGKPSGAFIKIEFTRPLELAIRRHGLNGRGLLEAGFDGVYDKNGETQVPHQILLFTKKPLGMDLPDLNRDLVDWSKTTIIPFDNDRHGYLNGYDDPEEAQYY